MSLATMKPVNFAALNLSFGTDLRDGDCELFVAPRSYQETWRRMPTKSALLEICLNMRWAQELDRSEHYDVLFSTSNEYDFHRRGIQYVHYPWSYLPRPKIEMSWYHRLPSTLALYRKLCTTVARATPEGLWRNTTLANSEFVAERIRASGGDVARVVFPPTPGESAQTPWEQRRLAIAAVGRIHPSKRWEMAVEIVERVRWRGHDVGLTLIGHNDNPKLTARLKAMAATRPWFRLITDVDRSRLLAELAEHRYGIHPMEEEHFGIGPAELQCAGCITFVHNSGGPVEIVGRDSRLTFAGVEDAAAKITTVVGNPALERELVGQVAERRDWFSTEKFCESIREVVGEFLGTSARPLARHQTA